MHMRVPWLVLTTPLIHHRYNYSIVVADRAADSAVVLSGRLRVAGGILYTYTV